MTSRPIQLIVGLALGSVLAVLGLVFGVPGTTAALILVSVIGLLFPRYLVLAGGWIGLGVTWLVLIGRASMDCARPEMPCGATPPDMTWLLAIALVIALAGGLAAFASLRRSPPT